MTPMLSILYLLFSVTFSIICYSLLIRMGLYYFRVSSHHQVSQLINTLTNPLVNPSKKLIDLEKSRPALPYNVIMTFVAAVIIKYMIAGILFYGAFPLYFLIILISADLLILPINLLFFAVLIRAVMGWVNPNWRHPINDILVLFTEPLLKLGRLLIPNISGFDFSPLLILVLLQVLSMLISGSLPAHLL